MLCFYSRCTEPKDVRRESNGKFITYSYPPPFTIITTISRHLQWLQSWDCIQAIRAASPTALTAAPSVMGLILKGSIPLETQWLIETPNSLLASRTNETQQEASMMAEPHTGLRSRVGGDFNIVSMVLDEALTLLVRNYQYEKNY